MRKKCKQCPYKIRNNHNDKFLKNVKFLSKIGVIENNQHTCHMIKSGWDKPTEKNICIGCKK